ncbi:phosphate propanoyltransferase [bacterium]|nr:phosphate propanoyltransferase [bacterium]
MIRKVTEEVARRLGVDPASAPAPSVVSPLAQGIVPVGISARHVHVTAAQVELLFGPGAKLTPMKPLSQPGQFAAEETVTLVSPRGRTLERVRILGPARSDTQVELSQTDCIFLGIKAPVRASGDHRDSGGILIVGPKGHLSISTGVIRANRHLHLHTSEAALLGLKDNAEIAVRINGERPAIFFGVQVRVSDKFAADLHLDTDDGNAIGLPANATAQIIKG